MAAATLDAVSMERMEMMEELGERDACCGEHPYRFPFSAKNNRACCHDRTYDQR